MGKKLVVDHDYLVRFLFNQYKPYKKSSVFGRLIAIAGVGLLFFFEGGDYRVKYFSLALTAVCVLIQGILLFVDVHSPAVVFLSNALLLLSISIHSNLLASIMFFGSAQPRYIFSLVFLFLAL